MLLYDSAGISILTFIIIHLEPGHKWAYPLNMSVPFPLFCLLNPKGSGAKVSWNQILEAMQEPSIGHLQVGGVLRWGRPSYCPQATATAQEPWALQGQGVFVLIITPLDPDVDMNLKQPNQITQSDGSLKILILASKPSAKSDMLSLNSHNSEIVISDSILQVKKLTFLKILLSFNFFKWKTGSILLTLQGC